MICLPSLGGGGAERVAINLANHWVSLGITTSVVVFSPDLLLVADLSPGVICVPAKRLFWTPFHLTRVLYKVVPDILLVNMWPLTSLAIISRLLYLRRLKLFLCDHTHLSVSVPRETSSTISLLKVVISLTYPFASGVIAVSQGVLDDLKTLSLFRFRRSRVIYNPLIDVLSLQNNPNLTDDNFNPLTVLSVGSFKEQKNFTLLIRAFKTVSDILNARLVLLGDGPQRHQLYLLANELQIADKVLFPGFILDTSQWYTKADLFVLSSSWEGFGNVLVEALSHSLPIVSTDCPSGPAEILEYGKYGILVQPNDEHSLASSILEALTSPHDSYRLYCRSLDFSIQDRSSDYLGFFFSE